MPQPAENATRLTSRQVRAKRIGVTGSANVAKVSRSGLARAVSIVIFRIGRWLLSVRWIIARFHAGLP
jgi:hypothetical protein